MTANTGRRIGTVIQQVAALVLVLVAVAPAQAQTETVEYYALDAIGSVRVVFDTNGNVLGRMDYDPYGAPLSAAAGLPSRAYAGLFRDEEGLDYAQARMYQRDTGRFNAPDPIYAGLLEPQQWNRYSYALNSPLKFTDYSGLTAQACAEAACFDEKINVTATQNTLWTSLWFIWSPILPTSSSNDTSAFELGLDWLTGTGPRVQTFTDGDPLTEDLKNSPHIEDIRELVSETCTTVENKSAGNNLSGIMGVPKYFRDYSTLLTFGQTGNLSATFLGSYSLRYSTTKTAPTEVQWSVRISNTSSLGSALRPPFVGYTQWWIRNVADPITSLTSTGPLSPTRQTITWTETVQCSSNGSK